MSDTPRTDAVKIACGFQAVPAPMLQHTYQLERENAALREDKEQLKRESAALWESKERLFYLSEHWNPKNDFKNDEIGKWIVIGDYERMIAAIDAARKEAQP